MKLSYDQIGHENKKSLVIVHGFMGSSKEYIKLAEDLSSHFNCYLINLPGHGKSKDLLDDFPTIDSIAIEINNFAKSLPNPHYYGYSLGGRVGFALADLPFCAFMKILIESSNPGISDYKEKKKRYSDDCKLFDNVKSETDFKIFLDNWYSQDIFGDYKSLPNYNMTIVQKLKNNDIESLKKAISQYSIGNQKDYWQTLKTPSCLSLYIYGEKDEKYKKIANRISEFGWKSAQVNGCGHNTHSTDYNNFLIDFKKFMIG